MLSTAHAGAPTEWRWRYLGVLTDAAMAHDLGFEHFESGTITLGRDGKPLFLAVPTDRISSAFNGCIVLEIDSLDPPRVGRDATGAPVVRARLTGLANMSHGQATCAYDAASSTGMITVTATSTRATRTELRATGMRP